MATRADVDDIAASALDLLVIARDIEPDEVRAQWRVSSAQCERTWARQPLVAGLH